MTGGWDVSDRDFALRAQDGDRHAFNQLVLRHKASLYRFVRRYIGNSDDAYDILQDTFISAWMALRRYDPERSFATWLRAIALNKCRDHGRRVSVRQKFLRLFALEQTVARAPASDATMEHDTPETLRLRRLDEAVAALPGFYKEPLLLTTVGGLSQQEAALQLNTTAKAIEMRLRRARLKLAEALSDISGEG